MRTHVLAISSVAMAGMMLFSAKGWFGPVTRIEFPRHKQMFVIPNPADLEGNYVVVVPPKTPFAILHDVDLGDEIVVNSGIAESVRYRVRSLRVIAQTNTAMLQDFGDRRLTLLAPYPFNKELRYAVVAIAK
jgi:Sortase domain